MIDYLVTGLGNAFRQLLGGFGFVFLLAFPMWLLSQRRRGEACGWMGKSYYYFVAPGVMFHELGHALGCVITLTRISKMVLFHPEGDTLGYVQHVQPTRFVAVREFVIATGPVWLGCLLIGLLGWFLNGSGFLPDYAAAFPAGEESLVSYVMTTVASAFGMFKALFTAWDWTSPLHLFLLYLLFCITSEITLSPPDISGMWGGIVGLVVGVLVFNLVPGLSWIAGETARALAPAMFVVHASLLFVLLIDFGFYLAFSVLMKVFRR